MKMKARVLSIVVLVFILVSTVLTFKTAAPVSSATLGNRILQHALDIEMGVAQREPHEALMSSGVMRTLLESTGEIERRTEAVEKSLARLDRAVDILESRGPAPFSQRRTQGCQNVFIGPNVRNVRVNQDCGFRFQSEEAIGVNPRNPENFIAGYNDGRIGFNHGAYAWSFDGGRTWGDLVPPFWGFLLGDAHTTDAFSDPAVTFDTSGNAYISGVFFDAVSAANAVLVSKSNAAFGGSFYHAPRALPFQAFRTTPGVVVNDNNPNVAHDKPLMVSDANPLSPKANNVYVTWTRFAVTGVGLFGVNSPINFSQSTDGGATWSRGVEISGANAAFCTFGSAEANPNACDQDQGSHPIVGPDGTVYVAFANFNTPLLGINQTMVVSCPAAADCTNPASWTVPIKIADLFGTHPIGPDPATGCPAGRQCLPPNGYRVSEFSSGSLSVDDDSNLYFAWSDFRNGGGTCTPLGPAALVTPPCNNDVFYAFSTNGGATWSGPINVAPARRFGPTAQWQPWSGVAQDGDTLWVAYYDRSYGNCEFTGCNDITLARIRRPAHPAVSKVSYRRLTTSSMPNLVPANNPLQAGFLGDYMWVTVDQDGRPHVVWSDTRGREGTVEEDVYYALIDWDHH